MKKKHAFLKVLPNHFIVLQSNDTNSNSREELNTFSRGCMLNPSRGFAEQNSTSAGVDDRTEETSNSRPLTKIIAQECMTSNDKITILG